MTRHHTLRTAFAALAALALALLPAMAGAEHTGANYAGGVENGDEYRDTGDDAYLPAYGDPGYGDSGTEAPAGYDTGYSYVRNLEGSATLLEPGGERQQLERNMPLLAGDHLWVAPRSRVEVLLSDGNLLRLDADSEVTFQALAMSPESEDRATVLALHEGNLQLVVFADALGDELPRVDLPNATFYAGEAGRFRLTSDRGDWSQVVARSGWAEVVTERESSVVRSGEELLVDGARAPRTLTRQAAGYDSLESWGRELDARVAAGDRYADMDRSLRYAAAPLDDHGSWISIAGQYGWRPDVDADWSPYRYGRWHYTGLGMTWVSNEPWGWVPYHYGTWDFVPGHGWVWYPGASFAPAWVYWYWGPSHVAWVPSGYYTRFYRHRFHLGVFGWYGGPWDAFDHWVVCPTGYFGHRHLDRYAHDGRYWHRRYGDHPVPRGIIATDTRPLGRDRWRDPEEAMRILRTRPDAGISARGNRGGGAELPDMSPYVARSPKLPDEVRRVVRVDATPGRTVRGRGAGGAVADAPRAPVVRARPGAPAVSGRSGDDPPGAGPNRATGSRPTVIRRPGLEGLRTPPAGVSDGADRGERNGAADPGPRRNVRPRVYTAPEAGERPGPVDPPRTLSTPRSSGEPSPGVARSPRFRGDDGAAARPTPPPRSQRAGTPESPARRVIRGARSSAGRSGADRSSSSGSGERPAARSRTPVRTPRSTPSAGSGSPSRSSRPSARSRSSSGSSGRSSARSRSSSGSSRSSARSRSTSSSSRSSAGRRSSGSRSRSSSSRRARSRDDGDG